MSAAPDWNDLRLRYPASWVDYLERSGVRGRAVNLDRERLAKRPLEPAERRLHPDLPATAEALLAELATAGWLTAQPVAYTCPVCGHDLGESPPPDNCPNLDDDGISHAYADAIDAEGPLAVRPYHRPGIVRRDVGWLLALHGMNSRGPWQEAFNWLVSTSYGRMVPVAIFKYGVIRPGVLSRGRQRTLMDQIVERIRRAAREVAKIIDDPRPDVIAHSFGTLLLGHALHRHPEVRVGRIITLGCILRPDFDWATLVERGQVDAVLNHYSRQDGWARVAHYAIPDAGPAGHRGFDFHEESWPEEMRVPGSRRLLNIEAEGLGHSDFFRNPEIGSNLARLFRETWQPFLTTRKTADLAAALESTWADATWRESGWPRRAITGGWRRAPHTVADRTG